MKSMRLFNRCMMRGYAKEKFVRKGAHLNVGTVGHVDHGKTTLSAAITKILAEKEGNTTFKNYAEIDNAPEEKARGITINSSHVEYSYRDRHYSHADMPGHADFVKAMICSSASLDGAILVVGSDDGPMLQTREHLWLCKQAGISRVVVFLNKVDLVGDDEMVDIVEEEVRELLTELGFDGDNTPIVRGSALKALEGQKGAVGEDAVLELMDHVTDYIETPKRQTDKPFTMPVEQVFNIAGRGTVVTGKCETGTLTTGQKVEAVGFTNTPFQGTVTGIEMFHKIVDKAEAGDNLGLLIRGADKTVVRRGQVISIPGNIKPVQEFDANIYVMSKEEGGRAKPFFEGFQPQFFFMTADINGTVTFLNADGTRKNEEEEDLKKKGRKKDQEGLEMALPGETKEVAISLLHPMPITEGLTFTIRESNKTIGAGRVTRIYESTKK